MSGLVVLRILMLFFPLTARSFEDEVNLLQLRQQDFETNLHSDNYDESSNACTQPDCRNQSQVHGDEEESGNEDEEEADDEEVAQQSENATMPWPASDVLRRLTNAKIKVFVYELPPSLNSDLLNCYFANQGREIWEDFREEKGQNTADIRIHRLLLKHPFRTLNALEADLFFVPFYGFLSTFFVGSNLTIMTGGRTFTALELCHGRSHYDRVDELANFLNNSKIFQERPQAHVLPVSFWAVTKEKCNPLVSQPSVITGQLYGLLQKSILLVYEPFWASAVSLDDYTLWPGPVVTIPYVAKTTLSSLALADIPSMTERNISFFFQGTLHSNTGQRLSRRDRIADAFSKLPGAEITDSQKNFSGSTAKGSYENGMLRSTFCLVIEGDTPSSARLFDALTAGCIPLIASEKIVLPFSSFLDWKKFSLRTSLATITGNSSDREEGAPSVKEISVKELLSMSTEDLEAMHREVLRVREDFIYAKGFPDDFKAGKALDMILHSAAQVLGLIS